MRSRTLVAGALAAATATLLCAPGAAVAATASSSSAAAAAAAAAKPDQHVIVVLKDQPAAATPGSAAAAARSKAIAKAQAPVIARVQSQAKAVHGYRTSDAFAATLSTAAVATLKADSAVAAVVPDASIRLAPATIPSSSAGRAGYSASIVPGACTAKPQLDEAPVALKADSDDPHAKTARSLGYTGKGVKVAYIAEGIDTRNINFRRNPADPASTVFSDYKDFSGDGPNAETTGGEAFLDANAIAGQGKHVYDVSSFSATPTPSPCNVRIEGTAPGVSLVGLKVFSENSFTTESDFLQAIDYAVQVAHVDVLNESFGSNAFPDVTTSDVQKMFNDAAVAAGVTVTVSSGDSGPFNTNGSPSTDPKVIAAGATTTFRFYAQDNYANARYFAPNGWLNNNISALSSSGVTQTGGTLDVVAPGDLSWASCTPSALYDDCTDDKGNPSDLESSGGTSESAPLTAGVAALVIQAYREAHHGASPAPATVKRIITSTATDLGAPASEQGAGLVDAYRAVQLAASMTGGARQGDTLLKSADQLTATALPGSTEHLRLGLTNTGSRTQHIALSTRGFGADHVIAHGSVTLSDASSAKVTDWLGRRTNVEKFTFHVGSGHARLNLEYAYPGKPGGVVPGRVRVDLVTPDGKLAANSIPQGLGNHGEASVLKPQAGTWTAYVYAITSDQGGVVGAVPYQVETEDLTGFGSLSQRSITLRPGESRTVTVTTRTPATPGDATGSVVICGEGGTTSVPIALRSAIDTRSGGRFAGTLTGGNGREVDGQAAYYRFHVPAGVTSVTANLALATEPQNAVGLYLVSPHGDVEGYGQNSTLGASSLAATAWSIKPTPGDWTLLVSFASPTAGDLLRIPFTGSITFDRATATAAGLPQHGSLVAGKAVTVPVRITNNGAAPASFFVDARLTGSTPLLLAGLSPTTGVTIPLTTSEPEWFVPSETTRVTAGAVSPKPIQFDLSLGTGDPDVGSHDIAGGGACTPTQIASYATRDRTVASGLWYAAPSLCGPYSGPAVPSTVDVAAIATTRAFDSAVTSTTGDAELLSIDPAAELAPVTLAPGASAVVPVTITPTGAHGSRVTGSLFVDALIDDVPSYGQLAADELVELPYSYTIR